MGNKCECETDGNSNCGCESPKFEGTNDQRCGHGPSSGGNCSDPVTMAQIMFQKAFFKALFEIKVEKLKKNIEEKWGANLDEAAKAVIEAMEKEWQAMITGGQAKQELHNKLASILTKKK
ncbi:MAG: hypothetical protein WB511_12515 [Nitrososphaeraceae archaeon]